jgi:hypothetical protein
VVTFGDVEIVPVPPLVTAATDPIDDPGALRIRRFYPNPFRGHTLVEYGIPEKADVEIGVYDAAGRLVCAERLPDVPGGWRTYVFRRVDSDGNMLPSGVYFCRFNSPGGAATKKVVILR